MVFCSTDSYGLFSSPRLRRIRLFGAEGIGVASGVKYKDVSKDISEYAPSHNPSLD